MLGYDMAYSEKAVSEYEVLLKQGQGEDGDQSFRLKKGKDCI